MGDFADKLAALTAAEASAAHGDADRLGVMIERLAAALGFTVAMAARGNAGGIDTLMAGAEGYAHAEAVSKAPLARFMADARNCRHTPKEPT
jgi:hypothetical protein